MASVVRHTPTAIGRLRASLIYRLGAVPRGETMGDCYVEPALGPLRSELEAKRDEIAMLRLALDVARADAEQRARRLAAVESELGLHSQLLSRIVRAAQAIVDRPFDGD